MTRGLTREFRLVAACCAWPPSVARNERIRSLAADQPAWAVVTSLAARHRVDGLLSAALEDAEVTPPPTSAQALRARAMEVAQRSLTQAAESARLQALLDNAGLANLLLKGAAVEVLAYGALGHKDAWDIDLLVAPSAVVAAIAVLEGNGYQIAAPAGLRPTQFETFIALARECELRHPANGQTVELHWGLVDGPVLLPGLGVSSPSQTARAGGLSFRTLAPEELFAYLCVHGAMHGWARLKWLADLTALISGETDRSLAGLVDRARVLGAGAAPDQALEISRQLLAADLGPETHARLRYGARERWLVRSAVRIMTQGGPREPSEDRRASAHIFAAQFALCGGWRGAWRQLAFRAVSIHDRVRVPLPPALRFLYPILRGPLWLGRRFGELW